MSEFNNMIGKIISHYKILEKLGEARLLKTCTEILRGKNNV